MLCSLITFTSCDEVLSTLDNPVSPYLELQSNSTVIGLGETDTIKASTISTMPVYYVSSNPEVVTVDDNGVLTPVADGDATITVKVDQDPSKAYNPGETKFEVKVRTPLTFQALEDGKIIVRFYNNMTLEKPINYTIIGKNKKEQKSISDNTDTTIDVEKDEIVQFKSSNEYMASAAYRYVNIQPQSKCAVYGNVMSMITDGDFLENKTITQPYALYYLLCGAYNWTDDGPDYYTVSHDKYKLQLPATQLFDYCYGYLLSGTGITEAPELPATELAYYCYSNLFNNCQNLTKAPKLPATTLAYGCYSYMFSQCDLTEAPELPAKELVPHCYRYMFRNNYNLTKAPKLPATTLANYCYQGMFQNCTALTSAPDLPAETLAPYCYRQMFQNCTKLASVKCLAKTNAFGALYSWLANAGTNVDTPTLTHSADNNNWISQDGFYSSGWYVPSNWTIAD